MYNRFTVAIIFFILALSGQIWASCPDTDDAKSVLMMPDTSSLIIGEQSACIGDTIQLAITVEDFVNVNGFQFSLEWEAADLTFVEACEMAVGDPDGNLNDFPGFLNAVWIDLGSLNTITLNDGDTLMVLKFVVLDITDNGIPVDFSFITPAEISVETESGGNAFFTPFLTEGNITLNDNINLQATGTPITCSDTLATLSATSSNPQTIFEWTGSNGFQTNMADTLTNIPDVYMVTGIEGNCMDTAFYEVLMDTLPPTGVIASGGMINCDNPTADLQGQSTDGMVTYQWLGPDSTLQAGQNLTVMDSGIYELQVRFTGNGCITKDTALVALDTLAPDITLSLPDTLTCAITETTLTISSTNPGVNCSWENVQGNCDTVITDPGTYHAIVIDPVNGCQTVDSVEVFQDVSMPMGVVEVSNELNCIDTNAILEIDSVLPHVVYTWIFENTDTLAPLMPLVVDSAGTYTLHLLDTLSACVNDTSVSVIENVTPPSAVLALPDTISCTENSVALMVEMSAPNTTVEWLDSNLNPIVPAIASSAGIYYVDLTNTESLCTARDSVLVFADENIPTLTLTYLSDSLITCTQPQVNLNVSSNVPVEITWTTPTGTEMNVANIQVSEPGEISVFIENPINECTNETMVIIEADTLRPELQLTSSGQLDCQSSSVLLVANATANNIEYQWENDNNAVLSQIDSVLVSAPGNYMLTATNSDNGCFTVRDTTISENIAVPVIQINGDTEINCEQQNLVLEGTANTLNSIFQWRNEAGDSLGMDPLLTVDSIGIYLLIVQDSLNGCSDSLTVEVTSDINLPTALLEANGILDCNRDTVNVMATPGSSNTIIEWQNSNLGNNQAVTTAGWYLAFITDTLNNCTTLDSIEVLEDRAAPALIFSFPNDTMLTCNIDAISLDIESDITVSTSWTAPPVGNFGTSTNLTVEFPGVVTATVQNEANGCTTMDSIAIEADTISPSLSLNTSGQLGCNGDAVVIQSFSNTVDLDYYWVNADNMSDTLSTVDSLAIVDPGTYILVVTNPGNGCSEVADTMIQQDMNVPVLSISGDTTLSCEIDRLSLTGSAEMLGVDFIWISPEGDTVGTMATIEVESPGIYTLNGTNTQNGCSGSETIEIGLDIDRPSAEIDLMSNLLTCNLDSIQLTANSNLSNAVYTWTNSSGTITLSEEMLFTVGDSGTYILNVLNPENECDSSVLVTIMQDTIAPDISLSTPEVLTCQTTETTVAITSNTPGVICQWENNSAGDCELNVNTPAIYTATVSNPVNGCISMDSVQVTESTELPLVNILSPDPITCNQEMVTLSTDTLLPNVIYTWMDTAGAVIEVSQDIIVEMPGDYQLFLEDTTTNCTNLLMTTVTENVSSPTAQLNVDGELDCITTSVGLSAATEPQDVEVVWSFDPQGEPLPGAVAMEAGFYYALLTNPENGCTTIDSIEVMASLDTPSIALNFVQDSILTCVLTSLDVMVSSDEAFTANWTLPSGTSGNGSTVAVNEPGLVSVIIQSQENGCTSAASVEVGNNQTLPEIAINIEESFDCLFEEAILSTQNNSNYQYQWNGPDANAVATPNQATTTVYEPGLYILQVTNTNNGCVQSDSLLMEDNAGIQALSIELIQPGCENQAQSGSLAVVEVLGGTGPYEFSFENQAFASQDFFPNLSPGDYRIIAQDANGCTYDSLVTIEVLQPHIVQIEAPKNPIDLGERITLSTVFDIPISDISDLSWFSEDSLRCQGLDCFTLPIEPTLTTVYEVISTDVNGCSSAASIEIFVSKLDQLFIPNVFSPNEDGINDVLKLFAGSAVNQILQMRIFDRWGEQLFSVDAMHPNDPEAHWDGTFRGKKMPQGVYVYWLKMELLDGSIQEKSGDFTIMR